MFSLLLSLGIPHADRRILRLIRKWLKAGVSEDGQWSRTTVGTPQGSVISPILANVFLHYVFDLWANQWRNRHARGAVIMVRYADDFVMGFSVKGEAERVFKVLPKRFERYGLSIHPEKSRLVQFSRPYWKRGKGPGSFAFLGFTHYWAKTLRGGWTIKRKTQGKRLSRFMSGIGEWCKGHRHEPLANSIGR